MVQRRTRPEAPTRTGGAVPDQVARADFVRPEAPWLVAVFSSTTCDSCAGTWEKARQLESTDVAVQDVPYQTAADLHRRYAIDAVPIVVVADADGVVRVSFLGPVSAAELWAKVAELRDGQNWR